MSRMEKAKERCIEVAKTSEHDTKLGTVLLKKGRIVLETTNIRKTHPQQAKWAKRVGKPKKIHLHAEMRALILNDTDFDTLLVARIDKNGDVRLAKPCSICHAAIEDYDEDVTVLYTTNEGNWEVLD